MANRNFKVSDLKVCVQNTKLFSHKLQKISELLKISKLRKKNFKDFLDKNVFPDNFFFKEFFIAFKTITLYTRDMYVFV